MLANKEVDLSGRFEQEYQADEIGDVKFVLTHRFLSFENKMPCWKNILMKAYYNLRLLSVKEKINYGLDAGNIIKEKYPLIVTAVDSKHIMRNERAEG